METAAIVAVGCLAAITLFQIGLALGAPCGSAAWGGQHPGVLPSRFRIASAAAAVVIYPLLIAVILAGARLIEDAWLPGDGRVLLWALVGFFALGTVANLASRSRAERPWGAVSLVIAICFAVVASAT